MFPDFPPPFAWVAHFADYTDFCLSFRVIQDRSARRAVALPIDGGICLSVVAGLGEAGPGSPTPATSS
jgi:hypothetical protein